MPMGGQAVAALRYRTPVSTQLSRSLAASSVRLIAMGNMALRHTARNPSAPLQFRRRSDPSRRSAAPSSPGWQLLRLRPLSDAWKATSDRPSRCTSSGIVASSRASRSSRGVRRSRAALTASARFLSSCTALRTAGALLHCSEWRVAWPREALNRLNGFDLFYRTYRSDRPDRLDWLHSFDRFNDTNAACVPGKIGGGIVRVANTPVDHQPICRPVQS